MAIGLLLPIRIAQAVFAIVVLGLSGYVSHWYNTDTLTASPSQINFLVFVPVFTLISILYLEVAPRFMSKGTLFTLSRVDMSIENHFLTLTSISPIRSSRSRAPQRSFLLRRLHRTLRIHRQASLLSWFCLWSSSCRCSFRCFQLVALDGK
ncbi:hypothetical protein OCU04_013121 [Sclerotinia nivalis]|uniref:MARVEL domain-containing protein n=1 Tax=Sclerotinia nivalis TaxID=352851 RepID=A0A9X0DDV5_9HELO|nr:hypothetical protein OCU04_013121 [Sclerotinia nivalis]